MLILAKVKKIQLPKNPKNVIRFVLEPLAEVVMAKGCK